MTPIVVPFPIIRGLDFLHLNPGIVPSIMRVPSGYMGVSYTMRWRSGPGLCAADMVGMAVVADWGTRLAKHKGQSYIITADIAGVVFRT